MTHPAARELRQIRGERFFQVFDDWLELSLAAFCRDEDRYMATMKRYGARENGKEHPADHFARALGAIQFEMVKDNDAGVIRDHLGEIYETEGASEKEMAQYFTPMPLCQLMANMTIDEAAPEEARIADPACGSGRLLLACIKLRPKGHYFGVDLDRTCAKMAALNMLWRNVHSCIVWGDTLRLKGRGGWMTASTALGGQIQSFDAERAQAILEASVRAMAQPEEPGVKAMEDSAELEQAIQAARQGKRGQFEMDF